MAKDVKFRGTLAEAGKSFCLFLSARMLAAVGLSRKDISSSHADVLRSEVILLRRVHNCHMKFWTSNGGCRSCPLRLTRKDLSFF